MSTWKNPRWGSLRGSDNETLRAIFSDLSDFLKSGSARNGFVSNPFTTGAAGSISAGAGLRSVTIFWDGAINGSYEVQIATNAGFSAGLQTANVTGRVTSFTNLSPNTTYFTRVRTKNTDGSVGAWSSTVSVTTAQAGSVDISANAISASHIQAGVITADHITAAGITADKIIGGTITASNITGVTITGGTFRTAASGQRIEMVNTAFDRINFYSGDSAETAPGAFLVATSGGAARPDVQIAAPRVSGDVSASGLLVRHSSTATDAHTIDSIINGSTKLRVRSNRTIANQIVNRDDLYGLPAIRGTSGTYGGSGPAVATDQIYIEAGTLTTTTQNTSVSFPSAFTGVVSVVTENGDYTATDDASGIGSPVGNHAVTAVYSVSTTGFTVHMWQSSTGAYSGTNRINWQAVGW